MKKNKLTFIKVLSYKKMSSGRKIIYMSLRKCDCGKEKEAIYSNVCGGKTKDCGCGFLHKIKDREPNYVGKVFGDLMVLNKYLKTELFNKRYIKTQCIICGNKQKWYSRLFTSKKEYNCSKCNRKLKHGMSIGGNKGRHRIYKIWIGIKGRCLNENCREYFRYGGRGIKLYWKSFKDFKEDMYESYIEHVEKYGEKETTIDRIDNNGNYCKENCRRATYKEQANNKGGYSLINNKEINKIKKLKIYNEFMKNHQLRIN